MGKYIQDLLFSTSYYMVSFPVLSIALCVLKHVFFNIFLLDIIVMFCYFFLVEADISLETLTLSKKSTSGSNFSVFCRF